MEKEKVIIVHLNKDSNLSENQLESKIKEIKELVRASNSEVVTTVIQNLSVVNSKFYIGSGKVEEIRDLAEAMEADTIIFNNELSGSQMKNLEDVIDKKIVDRTGLILDIFATRAKTKESKLQIKLAQLEYRLPRLVGFRNYLSREGAGIGTRGPGEQKLEVDRRSLQREITSIKHKLEDIVKKREIKRSKRLTSNIPIVSLIGYSNAGKSTILNKIVNNYSEKDKEVYSDDLLFATLNTTARMVNLNNGKEIVITDTVGFISDLPTKLIESFKSTLEEIEDSDLLVIVVDSSNETYDLQIQATMDILDDMDLRGKEILYVFNKIDKIPNFKYYKHVDNEIYISSFDNSNIESLVNNIEKLLFKEFNYYEAFIPYSEYSNLYDVIAKNKKDEEKYEGDGIKTWLYINSNKLEKYRKYLI